MTPEVTLEGLQDLMKRQQYSGVTLVHWSNGKLKLVEFPGQRIQVRESLDKAPAPSVECRTT